MRIRVAIAAAAATLLATLAFAPFAGAAPTLGVSLEERPAAPTCGLLTLCYTPGPAGPISRSDTLAFYLVKVQNTSPNLATCKPETWSGTPTPTLTYQWLRDGASIGGATESTYSPNAGDIGHNLQCQVTGTNAGGASTRVSAPFYYGSAPSSPVPPPSGSASPTIEGASELTCKAPTTWNGAPTFTYQWLRNGVAIPSATGTATTTSGSNSLTSVTTASGTGELTSGSKVVTGVTTATGTFKVGQTLAVEGGIAPGTTIKAIGAGTLELSQAATATGSQALKAGSQPFAVGDQITGAGIPAGTTITAISGQTATLSAAATASASGVSVTVIATGKKYLPQSGAGEDDQNKVLQCMVTGKNVNGTAIGTSLSKNVGSPTTPPASTVSPAVSGAEWTSGTTVASLGVPSGITIANIKPGEATNWTCAVATGVCRTSQAIAPGAFYSTIAFGSALSPEAPNSPISSAYAAGGGALTEANAQDSFTIAPAIPFELFNFKAAAFEEGGGEIESFQAGSHPFAGSVKFNTPHNYAGFAVEDLHEVWTDLPVGFVGNPQSIGVTCPVIKFEHGECSSASAAGTVSLAFSPGTFSDASLADATPSSGYSLNETQTVYRLAAEKGFPAEFGFRFSSVYFVFRAKVRTESDYGITIIAPKNPQFNYLGGLQGAKFTFCGTGLKPEAGCYHRNETGATPQPLMTIGTKCVEGPPVTSLAIDTWQKQGANLPNGRPDLSDPHWFHASYPAPPVTGCDKLVEQWTGDEEPSLTVQPDNTNADTPAGYTAHLHIPQEGLTDPSKLSNSDLNNVRVVLAEGPTLNPSVGDGISTCSEAQMGMISESPIRFEEKLPHCPDGSKIGNALVRTPLLENPLRGSIYLAAQNENPFNSDYAIYLAIEEPDAGIVVKLAGKVVANPVTGQLTTVFTDNPELPFEDLTLEFFNGGRSSLANPTTCGTFTTHTELTPWAAADPYNPKPDEIAMPSDPISIVSGPGGSSCSNSPAERPFNLSMEAGSKNANAGATSPFSMRLTRPDGTQEISELTVKSPPGYSAYLKGIPACSEAQIKEAETKSGLAEREHPSCPSASHLGSINSGAGAGPTPLFTPGNVYLGGPYKGAPLSLVTITPALAGADQAHPSFDLGNVVVRVAIYVDRATASITAKTDPIPRIIKGIPLRIRDIRVNLDRPNWGLNPTNCDPSATSVAAKGSDGATATVSTRFQVGGCENLAFKPKLTAKVDRRHPARRPPGLHGGTELPARQRLRQHQRRPGRPAALGVLGPVPHQHDLHPGAGRGQRLSRRARYTATPKRKPRCWTESQRSGLPQIIRPPAARPGDRAERPRKPAGRSRIRRAASTPSTPRSATRSKASRTSR